MVSSTLALLVSMSIAPASWASELCASRIASMADALQCAEERAPEVLKTRSEFARAKAQVAAASQWKNPELNADSLHGKTAGQKASETNVSLGVPLEIGGKIGARAAGAEAGVLRAEAELFAARASARTTVLIKLHRLRQLLHELEVVEESVSTFSKLVNQYSRRFKLSPEQEMSVAVFRMAKSEYELKKADLLEELSSLDAFFRVTLGLESSSLKQALPACPRNWPQMGKAADISSSPKNRVALAGTAAAVAELEAAKAEAWPTVVVGPSIKIVTEAGRSDTLYGFTIGFPLPIFNANGAGKSAAAAALKSAEVELDVARQEQEAQRDELLRTYQASVTVLSSTLAHSEIEKKHSQVESLFVKGIVPSSLVIEAHRTFVELEISRNQREIKALNALAALYLLEGKQMENLQ